MQEIQLKFSENFLHGQKNMHLSETVQGLLGWGLKDTHSIMHTHVMSGKC